MSRELDRQVMVRLEPNVKAAVERIANETERTVSQVIRLAIKRYVAAQVLKDSVAAAKEDIASGRAISWDDFKKAHPLPDEPDG
jgi:predicted transcriptional regulator